MPITSSMTTALTVLLLILLGFDPVQPQPVLISGPDDVHVFKDVGAVNLTCNVTRASGYFIVWLVVNGSGQGIVAGRCFNCPTQESCAVFPGMDNDYIPRKDGDSYILTVLKPQIPTTSSFGYVQCGYQELQNCDSVPTTVDRFNLLRTAIVYVYNFPSCSSAVTMVTTTNGIYVQDLTCTWTPRFYDHTANKVKAELSFDNAQVQPDVKLPHGIVKRYMSDSLQELEEATKNVMCTVVLPEKSAKSCKFSLPSQQEANVVIEPLYASIKAGKVQEFYCNVQPNHANTTTERSWEIFDENGYSQKINSSTSSNAGDVTFFTDKKESLLLKLHNGMTGDIVYFIECSVVTVDGRKVSAFASVQTLGTESTPVIRPTTRADIIQSISGEPEEETVKGDNLVGILIFVLVPLVLIIVFFVIGFVIVWKRTHKRSFKQTARMVGANYSNMVSNDNVEMNVEHDGDVYKGQGENK